MSETETPTEGQGPDPASRAEGAEADRRPLLRLYVAGAAPRSVRAIRNARRLCDELLRGQYALQVVDIYQEPMLAREGQVVAVPMLVRISPTPLRRYVGTFSDIDRLAADLALRLP